MMFRREALDYLSTPEGLDQMMEVTRPTGWLALVALSGVVLAVAGWGFFWTIPTTLVSSGIVSPEGGVASVLSPASGRLQELTVKTGDIVKPGQPIASLSAGGGANTTAVSIAANTAGRVIAVSAGAGDQVDQGTSIVTLEPVGQPLELVAYIPLAKASSVRPGMETHTTLSGIPASVFGYLRGTVRSVATYPATARDLKQILGTDELVREFTASGSLIEVHVTLTADPRTVSGYAWSTPKGPPFPLAGGTFASATVIISKQKPFRLLF
jgi:multidrug resistance efflux pump